MIIIFYLFGVGHELIMLNNRNKLIFFRQATDYLVLIISFASALFLTYQKLKFELSSFDAFFLLLLLVVWYFVSKSTELYDEFRSRNFIYEFIALLKAIIFYTIIMIIVLFMIRSQAHSRYFPQILTQYISISIILNQLMIL